MKRRRGTFQTPSALAEQQGSSPDFPVTEHPPATSDVDVIRTETVLSKLPVHHLTKAGGHRIKILKTSSTGEIELKWDVSPSAEYGHPGQLAYKIDTIVVDQKIEEVGKPLPERIRLGTLSDICRDLGIPDGGSNFNAVRNALLQNASVFIKAKIHYRGLDGVERTFEVGFSRYSVTFTGEKFPDGVIADAVYIRLYPDYRDLLSNAPFRPLDLAYKKQLTPVAQRFYEIVSYKIFAALKFNQPVAKLAYSEYCTFSAQPRYADYDHFKKQMYKVHRPHLASHYIAQVQYDDVRDEAGRIVDWIMCYTPGPKARADHAVFTGKRSHTIDAEASPVKGLPAPRKHKPEPSTEQQTQPPAIEIDPALIDEFLKRGISATDARTLVANAKAGQPILDQLRHGDRRIAQGSITNPQGFYISLIQENALIPPEVRRDEEIYEAQERKRKTILEEQENQRRIEEAERTALNAQIDALSPEALQALKDQAVATLVKNNSNFAYFVAKHPEELTDRDGMLYLRMRKLLKEGWAPPSTR